MKTPAYIPKIQPSSGRTPKYNFRKIRIGDHPVEYPIKDAIDKNRIHSAISYHKKRSGQHFITRVNPERTKLIVWRVK